MRISVRLTRGSRISVGPVGLLLLGVLLAYWWLLYGAWLLAVALVALTMRAARARQQRRAR